jgi:murein peptide amidase A
LLPPLVVELLLLLLLPPQPARRTAASARKPSLFMWWSMPAVRFLVALVLALPIGHSVQGRTLKTVVLGDGPKVLLVVGCIHGTETAGLAVTSALRPVRGATIVVLPALNPDACFSLRTRGNAHGVDLNRNFGSGWERSAVAGPRPLSEPEARYFVALVRALHPDVTVFFHQHEEVVRAWGQSRATALRFAALLGGLLPYRAVRWPPGAATRWQNRAFPRTASFVVELPAGPVPPAVVPRYVRALRELARVGFVR